MPLVHERTFRVRHSECDLYGHVNNTHYLRYMQETAIDASAAGGYAAARYAALGCHWLVRQTDVEYHSPLRYGDSVTVRTWLVDFRRVRSCRAYALRRVGDGQLVAQGATDWVYVDSRTGQPATIPAEMIAAFFPEGAPPPAPPRPRQPAPPPPPPGVFTQRRTVRFSDIDAAGHVNNAQYLSFVGDCGFAVAAAYGWPAARMQAAGFGILVRQFHIEHRQPALMDDELEIATWVYQPRRASAMRAYNIRRVSDGALVVEVQGHYVWVSLETGQPQRIPPDFMADFEPNVARGEQKP